VVNLALEVDNNKIILRELNLHVYNK